MGVLEVLGSSKGPFPYGGSISPNLNLKPWTYA